MATPIYEPVSIASFQKKFRKMFRNWEVSWHKVASQLDFRNKNKFWRKTVFFGERLCSIALSENK